jgi:hypothetical protein
MCSATISSRVLDTDFARRFITVDEQSFAFRTAFSESENAFAILTGKDDGIRAALNADFVPRSKLNANALEENWKKLCVKLLSFRRGDTYNMLSARSAVPCGQDLRVCQ